MALVDTVVFDIGNVLLNWNPRHLYRKLFADEQRMEWFLANVCTQAWNIEQDRGRSFAEAVAELTGRHPEWHAEIKAYDERWGETVSGPITGSVELLSRLKAKQTPLYAITNFSHEKFDEAAERFAFLKLFDGVIVSGRERLLKPDAAIYHLFLERFGLDAGRCLFIDDSARNVEAARQIGMSAVQFHDAGRLAQDLQSFELL